MPSVGLMPGFSLEDMGAAMNTTALTLTTTGLGAVFRAYKTGNISKLGRLVTARTGNCEFDFQMETLTGAPAVPTGTIWAAGATVHVTVSGTGWVWHTLGTPGAVVKDDYFAVAINPTVAAVGDQATIGTNLAALVNRNFPYAATKLAGVYTAQNGSPILAAQYDDGTVLWGGLPVTAIATTTTIATDTTPDEVGVMWTQPVGGTCFGVEALLSVSTQTAVDGTFELYEGVAAAASSIASVKVTAADMRAATSGKLELRFSTSVALVANREYRLVLKPSTATATGTYRLTNLTFESVASQQSQFGLFIRTHRTDAGTFTDTTTQIPSVCPVLDTISAGGISRSRAVY